LAENGARMCHIRFTSAVRTVMTSMLIISRTNREKKAEKSERDEN